jgi:metal transporter CNNM
MERPTKTLWYKYNAHSPKYGAFILLTSLLLTTLVAWTHQDSVSSWVASPEEGHGFLRVNSPIERALEGAVNATTTCALECCSQFEADICPASDNAWIAAIPFALQILLIIILITLSALFSGLTLGLLGLDKTGLEIVMHGDDENRAEEARKVYTVRENGNLLLCTLLLGNVAVNAFLSILMGEYFGGIIGLLGSTILIVIFGEILPQAFCARYALQIGSRTVPVVRVLIVLFYPFAAPLAFALNKALGNELATTYSSAEMRKLLQIHVAEGRFDAETAEAMTGALKYKDISVKEVMTSIENTYMLNVDERLSFETIATIFKKGYSRIPVYEVSRNNIIGLLFVKDLIFIDPEDETPVRNFVQIFGRGVHVVWPNDKLGDVLRELKKGKSHMALVRDVNNDDESQDPFYEIKGIITLEDIIEEIIGGEILDETDAFVDGTHLVKVDRMGEDFDWGRLRLLDAKILEQRLSYDEAKAVTAHLRTNYADAFVLLSDHQLQRLVAETGVDELPTAVHEIGREVPSDPMYEKGRESDVCTLILGGKVTVLAGVDKFRSDVSSWSVLGATAFQQASYTPDFTAFVSGGPCRCLRLTKERFDEAVDASAIERTAPAVLPAILPVDVPDTLPTSEMSPEKIELGSDPVKKRGEARSRRSKLIAALQLKSKADVIDEEEGDVPEESNRSKGVGYAAEGGLSSVLTDGGIYQPKRAGQPQVSLATSKASASQIEYIEPH